LESSDLPLEEGLTLFERGQALAARCNVLLAEAELKLKQLIPDEDGEYKEETIE
jgi:exodeoxyribonuclease VII small subunit